MTKASRLDELSMGYGILGVPDDENIENEGATEDSFDGAFEPEPESERVGPLAVPLDHNEEIMEDSFPTPDPPEAATAVTDPAVEEIRVLPLADIERLQVRWETNKETVKEYARKLRHGVPLPAPVVFDDGSKLYAADGNHTLDAYELNKETHAECRVRRGSRRDALLYAVGCNDTHGLPRTNLDKRAAVRLLLKDEEWGQWSNAVIARQCKVTGAFVGKLAKEFSIGRPGSKRTADGRSMDTAAIGKKAADEASQEDAVTPSTLNGLESTQSATHAPTDEKVVQDVRQPVADPISSDNPASAEPLPSVNVEVTGTGPTPGERKNAILNHFEARGRWFAVLQGLLPNLPKGVVEKWVDEVDSYSWLPEDAADALVQVDGLYERLNPISAQCSARRADLKGRPAPKEREVLSEIERRVKKVCAGFSPQHMADEDEGVLRTLERDHADVAAIEELLSALSLRLRGGILGERQKAILSANLFFERSEQAMTMMTTKEAIISHSPSPPTSRPSSHRPAKLRSARSWSTSRTRHRQDRPT